MPGMKLHFLKRTAQRGADAGKALPLKQVEAIIVYGKSEQRAKVVNKLLESVYGLALNRNTHHILLTVLDRCDSLTRVRLLYQVRRKLLDMSCSPVANVVVQRMLETLPRRQRREMAEALVLNVDAGELQRLAEHPSGNHVVQKMMEYAECIEVLEPVLTRCLSTLAVHSYGMRVVARYMECTPQGWRVVLNTLLDDGVTVEALGDDDMLAALRVAVTAAEEKEKEVKGTTKGDAVSDSAASATTRTRKASAGKHTTAAAAAAAVMAGEPAASRAVDRVVRDLFAASARTSCDSLVLRALLKHPFVPYAVKDAICAHLCEYAVDYLDPAALAESHRAREASTATHTGAAATAHLSTASSNTESHKRQKTQDAAAYMMPVFGEAAASSTAVAEVCTVTAEKTTREEDTHKSEPRHIHTYLALFEFGDDVQRGELWGTLRTQALIGGSTSSVVAPHDSLPLCEEQPPHTLLQSRLLGAKATMAVAIAAFKYYPACREELYAAVLVAPPNTNTETDTGVHALIRAAADPVRTLLLRTVLEVQPSCVTAAQREALCVAAATLWESPVASPVLQRLVEMDAAQEEQRECAHGATRMLEVLEESLPRMVSHAVGCFLVQALLQFAPEETRRRLVQLILTRTAFHDLHTALATPQGSRVMQKLLAYAEDDVIVRVVDTLITQHRHEEEGQRNEEEEGNEDADADADAEDATSTHDGQPATGEAEEGSSAGKAAARPPLRAKERLALHRAQRYDIESHKLVSYALHTHACFFVQALLRETRQRQLESSRKQLMNALKPHVFELAVSPWAGRVVLDAMLQCGSVALAEAIRNVVFYRAEEWLSSSGSTSTSNSGRAGGGRPAGDARAMRHGRASGGQRSSAAGKRQRE